VRLPKIFNSLLTICLFSSTFSLEARLNPASEVTYGLSGGRLGDNLLSVAHAAWLSHSLGIPLTYTPFPYSDQLKLSTLLKKPSCVKCSALNQLEDYTKLWNQCLSSETQEPLLISLPYFPEISLESSPSPMAQINWDDAAFIKTLRGLIAPLQTFEEPKLPADRVSVALHIRTGVGGIDEKKFRQHWPLKGPPLSFYTDALKILWEMQNRPLYVFIFTDDPDPVALQETLAKSFGGCDIVFACRKNDNRADKNVLEDFFAMGKFSCLIRPDSNYSVVASKIFPYQVVIAPLHAQTEDEIFIDKLLVQVSSKESASKPLRTVVVKDSKHHHHHKSDKEKEKERRRKEKEKEKERKRKDKEKKHKRKHH